VDTGAAYSWISRSTLEMLDIASVRRMQFRTIEGKVLERELAPVFLAIDGYIGGDNIVMAESGEMQVLGAHSLEALGLTVDPVQKKLLPQTSALALTAIEKF
jgi:predicted aspartyl protease